MRYELTQELIDRFNAKWELVGSGCFEWTASKAGRGYGQIKIPKTRRQEYAHRLAYRIYHGEIPDDKEVCHKCDNPACVNPDHLFLGSRKENAEDMAAKMRSLYGSRNPNSKLSDASVRKIRVLLAEGKMSQEKIARLFGTSQMNVSRIKRGIYWKHIE